MASIEIHLPDPVREILLAQMARVGVVDESDYLASLILQEERPRGAGWIEEMMGMTTAELEAKLIEGLDSPAEEMTDQDWADLRQEILDKHPELVDEA